MQTILRTFKKNCSELRSDCLKSSNDLICSIITFLELKRKMFQVFQSASDAEMDSFLKSEPLLMKDYTTHKDLESLSSLQSFILNCCSYQKYSITIKKCGKDDCSICFPIRMSSDVLQC